jgi:hypothetical protein
LGKSLALEGPASDLGIHGKEEEEVSLGLGGLLERFVAGGNAFESVYEPRVRITRLSESARVL